MSEISYQIGFSFDDAKEIQFDEFAKAQKPVWGHFHLYHRDTIDYLRRKSGLEEFVVDAMIAEETRPRFVEVNNTGFLVILRAINFHPDRENDDMVSVRLWIDEKRVISVVKKSLKSADEIAELFHKGTGPKSIGEFVVLLTKHILNHMEPVIGEIDECTENWEEELPEGEHHEIFSSLSDARKQVLGLRRHLAPERDVIFQLGHSHMTFFTKLEARQIKELHERATNYVEELDHIKERIATLIDELRSRLATHSNRAMYMFSLVAVIFLPLTFLTGLFGINVGGIPGSDAPFAFAIFSTIMLAIAFGLVWFFKRIRWF